MESDGHVSHLFPIKDDLDSREILRCEELLKNETKDEQRRSPRSEAINPLDVKRTQGVKEEDEAKDSRRFEDAEKIRRRGWLSARSRLSGVRQPRSSNRESLAGCDESANTRDEVSCKNNAEAWYEAERAGVAYKQKNTRRAGDEELDFARVPRQDEDVGVGKKGAIRSTSECRLCSGNVDTLSRTERRSRCVQWSPGKDDLDFEKNGRVVAGEALRQCQTLEREIRGKKRGRRRRDFESIAAKTGIADMERDKVGQLKFKRSSMPGRWFDRHKGARDFHENVKPDGRFPGNWSPNRNRNGIHSRSCIETAGKDNNDDCTTCTSSCATCCCSNPNFVQIGSRDRRCRRDRNVDAVESDRATSRAFIDPDVKVIKPEDSRDKTNLKKVLVYPPRRDGPPLTLYKNASDIECTVRGNAKDGFRYDVTYVQKFVSRLFGGERG